MNDTQDYKSFVSGTVRAEIDRMLSTCTPAQAGMYSRLYPRGPTYDQLPTAYDQVRRTVIKNLKKSAEDDA